MKQINDAVDRVAEVSERIGKVQQKVEDSGSNPTREHTLQTDKATLKKTKVQIDQLLDKLCACCGKKAAQTAPTPTPSTTDKVTDILKTIGGSVSIDVGGGGGDHRHHGEDRHRTAEKVPTDKTKTHTTSPTPPHKGV